MKQNFEYLLWRGLPALINVISIIVLSRAFGETVFGYYNLVFSTIIFVKTLTLNWVTLSVQRFYYEDELETVPSALLMTLLSGLPAALLFAFILPAAVQETWVIVLGAALLALEGLFELTLVWNRVQFRPRQYGQQLLLRAALLLVLGLAAAQFTLSPLALIAALMASALVPLMLLGRGALQRISVTGARQKIRNYARFGIPIAIATAISMQFMLVVKYSLVATQDVAAVGAFAVTSDIMQNGFFVMMLTVTLGLHPRLTKMWSEAEMEGFAQLVKRLLVAIVGLGVVLLIMVIAVRPAAHLVLTGVFLEAFRQIAVPLAGIYALAIIKVGVLDFLLGLQKQIAVQIIVSLVIVGAIALVARMTVDVQTMMYMVAAILSVTLVVEGAAIAVLHRRSPADQARK